VKAPTKKSRTKSSPAGSGPALVWLRLDLRLSDNPALQAALERGHGVLPVFVWAPEEEGAWPPGGASRWWLHQSLAALESSLRAQGSRLLIRRGPTLETLRALVQETGAGAVFWNRRYEPALIARDQRLKETLRAKGLEVESFNGALLREPMTVQNQSGKPFQVFTPFWKHCLGLPDPAEPLPAPTRIPGPRQWPASLALKDLALEPRIPWADGLRTAWTPGEKGAQLLLTRFLAEAFTNYAVDRDRPDLIGTSRLSPHLHFGEISPRQIWHATRQHAGSAMPSRPAEGDTSRSRSREAQREDWRSSQFLTELGWREFSHHLVYHFPKTPAEPLRPEFKRFPWRQDAAFLKAWQQGRTGYPVVDAGMRELWATGWMHNRVRMIVASFLVKDLLISWQQGAAWFWDTLVDADLAQNTLGWQWTAGCGADAAPYFRVFNPISQGEKFDPEGAYVRRWCPELRRLSDEWLHCPFDAAPEVLARAGVELGRTYPEPIVRHSIAREVALEAFAQIKSRPVK